MKKINLIYSLVLLMACATGLTSCKKYLDVNTSPNSVTTVRPDLLFTYASVMYSADRAGGDFYISQAIAAQTVADGGAFGWDAGNAYDISVYSTSNVWTTLYVDGGVNLTLAIKTAETSDPVDDAAAAQCKILLAQEIYDATMLWGDVPFSQAWQPATIPYPKFDTQKEVLDSLLSLLDEAIAQIPATAGGGITDGDLFYHGDLDKWKRVAYAMKLRILMVMVDKDPSKAAAIGELVQGDDMLQSEDDNFQFPFGTTKGNQNPKFELIDGYSAYFADGRNAWFFAHNSELKPMLAQNDPRLPKYFDRPKGMSTYIGVNGGQTADENTATISMQIYAADAPELIYSYQEQLFFQAEAYARGLGVAADLNKADEYYKKALLNACEYYGVSETDAQTFVDSKSLLSVANPVNEIHLQQWIDLMDRPNDAFTNWRRSGGPDDNARIPRLSIPEGAPAGGLMHRWPYSNDAEIDPNVNAPKDNPQYYEKLWFEQ